jgi:hypothetical protein
VHSSLDIIEEKGLFFGLMVAVYIYYWHSKYIFIIQVIWDEMVTGIRKSGMLLRHIQT